MMRSSRLSLGSMEVSCGDKDGSKRISKTKQNPNFDLSSLGDRTATVFSATFPSPISTIDYVDFSSSFHFLLLVVKVLFERIEEETEKQECFCFVTSENHKATLWSYINFKVL